MEFSELEKQVLRKELIKNLELLPGDGTRSDEEDDAIWSVIKKLHEASK